LAGVPLLIHTEHSPNPVGGVERAMTELFWRRTSAVITFAEQNADIIRQREPVSHFEIIRNGLPIPPLPTRDERLHARQEIGVSEETVVFGIVGSLQERKNHRLAFEALARIKDEAGPPVRLSLFGEGALRARLTEQAAELGIEHLVRFHGYRSDVRDLLPGIDVLVSVARLEMAPISILEAMATCTPVIATPHAGTEDMVQHDLTGLVVDWDAGELAAAMRRARDDAAWRAACGAAGRQRVERNHDIETIADQHVALYDRMLWSAVPEAALN
jgi:glycosyltransferase involved in cell wall biosynthesis